MQIYKGHDHRHRRPHRRGDGGRAPSHDCRGRPGGTVVRRPVRPGGRPHRGRHSLRRGKRPILVGGTGLWLDAVVQGRTFAGGHAGGAVRRELQAQLAREGIGPLLEELRQVDPEAAGTPPSGG
ncbi:MAG: hypothetical protein ACLTG0_09135 [Oscillibacter sp.]